MKRIITIAAILYAAATGFSSCNAHENYDGPKTIAPVVTNGAWKVGTLNISNNNQTTQLAGYSIAFKDDGTITASSQNTTISGNWREDAVQGQFNIDLGTLDANLANLNQNWKITEVSSAHITFEKADASGTNVLTLAK